MTIAEKAVVVTGDHRGIGQAPVVEGLRRGAKRVCAGEPQPLAHLDGRVRPLALDALDVLIDNAGIAICDDLSTSDAIEQNLGVNFFGPLGAIDTNMNRSFELPKASPESAALRMFDGLEKARTKSFPTPRPSRSPKAGALGAVRAP